MGHAPHAILAYGYDLGPDWGFGDLDQDQLPAWYTEEGDEGDNALRHLLNANGFKETWEDGLPDYHDRETAAKAALGVELVPWGDSYTTTYLLTARNFETDWEDTQWIEPDLATQLPANAGERLAWALKTLGVNPDQDRPRWILAAHMPG